MENTLEFKSRIFSRGVIYTLFVASIIGLFSGSNESIISILRGTLFEKLLYAIHTGNSILLNASSGYFGGFVIWYLLVKIPADRKRILIKARMTRVYQDFKKKLIENCLYAAGESISALAEERLMNPVAFKLYFHGQKWYDVANGLEDKKWIIQRIRFEMSLLEREVLFVLGSLEITDESTYNTLKNIADWLSELDTPQLWEPEYVKLLCRNMWEVLANFDRINGYIEHDKIAEAINGL